MPVARGSFSLDARCPYSRARALRHHVGKPVTATAMAAVHGEKEEETMDWETFYLFSFYFIFIFYYV